MKNKRAFLQISFSWIFALIVGGFILFLAIFLVVKLINTGGAEGDIKKATEIKSLLSPLETSFEEGKITSLRNSVESRIYSGCTLEGDFGTQIIKIDQEIYGKWSEDDFLQATAKNKYLFIESPSEGKLFYLFSKPLSVPFNIGSLIYLTSSRDEYCFMGNVPRDVENDLEKMSPPNIFLKDSDRGCLEEDIKICFGIGADYCDTVVDEGFVFKEEGKMYFSDDLSLMYAAIFSDPQLYECQLKRLVLRTENLVDIYVQKLNLPELRECSPDLVPALNYFKSDLENFEDSRDLDDLFQSAREVEYKNSPLCEAW